MADGVVIFTVHGIGPASRPLDPGEDTIAELTLDERAFAYWHPTDDEWRVDPGTYELHLGRSSADIAHVVSVER